MTGDRFPWYDFADGGNLEQGGIIPNCPCFLPVEKIAPGESITLDWHQRDLIVLSQTCDLVAGREKLTDVLLAAV